MELWWKFIGGKTMRVHSAFQGTQMKHRYHLMSNYPMPFLLHIHIPLEETFWADLGRSMESLLILMKLVQHLDVIYVKGSYRGGGGSTTFVYLFNIVCINCFTCIYILSHHIFHTKYIFLYQHYLHNHIIAKGVLLCASL